MNPNDILAIDAHIRDRQTNQSCVGANKSEISFFKDYIAKYCRSDLEITHLFKTEKYQAKITTKLPEAQIIAT